MSAHQFFIMLFCSVLYDFVIYGCHGICKFSSFAQPTWCHLGHSRTLSVACSHESRACVCFSPHCLNLRRCHSSAAVLGVAPDPWFAAAASRLSQTSTFRCIRICKLGPTPKFECFTKIKRSTKLYNDKNSRNFWPNSAYSLIVESGSVLVFIFPHWIYGTGDIPSTDYCSLLN